MDIRFKTYRANRKIGMSRYSALIASGFPVKIAEKYREEGFIPSGVDFYSVFEQKKMTDLRKVEHALEGMEATKLVSVRDGTDEDGNPTFKVKTVPDWTVRHKYYETMLRLCKQLEDKKVNVALIAGGEFADRLRKARLRAQEGMKKKFENTYVDVKYETVPRPEVADAIDSR